MFVAGISGLLGLNLAHQNREQFDVSGSYLNSCVQMDGVRVFELDAAKPEYVRKILEDIQPDIVINTVALTNVDQCEEDPALAQCLNVDTARNLAAATESLGARFVHISTDQLFCGNGPWKTETDTPAPINNYGRTKLLAERVVCQECPGALVIRTNFFGWGTSKRTSFSDWILQGLVQQRELTMFTDVFFTPILANQLNDVMVKLISADAAGVFHVAGAERLSKYAFALKLAEAFGYSNSMVRPTNVQDFSFKAPRPAEMSLSNTKAERCLEIQMPNVAQGLERLRNLQRDGWDIALENFLADRE